MVASGRKWLQHDDVVIQADEMELSCHNRTPVGRYIAKHDNVLTPMVPDAVLKYSTFVTVRKRVKDDNFESNDDPQVMEALCNDSPYGSPDREGSPQLSPHSSLLAGSEPQLRSCCACQAACTCVAASKEGRGRHAEAQCNTARNDHSAVHEGSLSDCQLGRILSSDCKRIALQGITNTHKQQMHRAPAQLTESRSADSFLDSEPVLLADNNDLSSTATSSSAYSANDLIKLARKLIAIENEPECNCGEC